MEALIITLREGVEAALLVGLILAYLDRAGQSSLKRYVFAGLGLALAASVAGAIGASAAGLNPENEVLEGTLLGIAALLVGSLVFWMWRASRGMKDQVEDRLATLLSGGSTTVRRWGLFGLTFFMVFREGVEVVLFLAALSLTASGSVLNIIGAVSGLGLAGLFGFVFARGAVQIDLRRFFAVTGVVLLILVLRLVAGSVHEFSEVGLLPSTPTEMRVIGFIVQDSTSIAILILLVLVPALAMLPTLRRRPGAEEGRPGESPVERRRRVAAARRSRRWQLGVVAVTMAIVVPLGAATVAQAAAAYRPAAEPVVAEGGAVRIPVAELQVGRLYKYAYAGPRAEVRLLVMRRSQRDIAVALDACNICPPLGYHQEGDQLICDNCAAPINPATIGLPGGCNPKPIDAGVEDGAVVIGEDVLRSSQAAFTG